MRPSGPLTAKQKLRLLAELQDESLQLNLADLKMGPVQSGSEDRMYRTWISRCWDWSNPECCPERLVTIRAITVLNQDRNICNIETLHGCRVFAIEQV